MRKGRNRAFFLDRDGVINRKAPEGDYTKSRKEFEFLAGVTGAIRKLNEKGFLVIVVSNQRGIAKGIMTEDDLKEIDTKMKKELRKEGARVDGIYYCPHDIKDHCGCRKPAPGMLLRAAKEKDIALTQSWMIGDSLSDIEAGKRAECNTIFIGSVSQSDSAKEMKPDFIAKSLAEAVDKFLDTRLISTAPS
jgi:histidinol-phosphate phosphatase family protein